MIGEKKRENTCLDTSTDVHIILGVVTTKHSDLWKSSPNSIRLQHNSSCTSYVETRSSVVFTVSNFFASSTHLGNVPTYPTRVRNMICLSSNRTGINDSRAKLSMPILHEIVADSAKSWTHAIAFVSKHKCSRALKGKGCLACVSIKRHQWHCTSFYLNA